ncbi:MAG: hypothetical protein MJZ24_08470 [Paludibacteraceae bacterium]|nr:hypothetical protein [Paludibacteraceae bacterium]
MRAGKQEKPDKKNIYLPINMFFLYICHIMRTNTGPLKLYKITDKQIQKSFFDKINLSITPNGICTKDHKTKRKRVDVAFNRNIKRQCNTDYWG